MNEPLWLTRDQVLSFQEDQLREHGGIAGIRDDNALGSALARPQQLFNYDRAADVPALAAAYAYGIARNHPFLDGNKRAALISAYVFLGLNGLELNLPEPQAVEVIVALAAGQISQETLADCFRKNTTAKVSG